MSQEALREAECLGNSAGAILVTPEGHVFTRHTVSFHAPDSELHGVLTRQREIEQLGVDIDAARPELESLRAAVIAAEPDVEGSRARIDELRGQGEIVILDLPGHDDTRAELGCTRALTQRDGKWQITPLHAAG